MCIRDSGSTANDSVGSGGVTELSNGAAVVRSPYYNGDGKSDTGRVDIIKEGSDPWDNPLAFSTNASQKSTIGVSSATSIKAKLTKRHSRRTIPQTVAAAATNARRLAVPAPTRRPPSPARPAPAPGCS